MRESKSLASQIGVAPKKIYEVFKADTDWEFIIKLDALLEAAVKFVVKGAFKVDHLDREQMEDFVDALPMRGRTSLMKLLEACGCEGQERDLIEGVRILRNGFAHDITQMEMRLIDVVKSRKDKSSLLKALCWIEKYDEKKLIEMYEKDGNVFRFGIMSGALTFMVAAYHSVTKDSEDRVNQTSSAFDIPPAS